MVEFSWNIIVENARHIAFFILPIEKILFYFYRTYLNESWTWMKTHCRNLKHKVTAFKFIGHETWHCYSLKIFFYYYLKKFVSNKYQTMYVVPFFWLSPLSPNFLFFSLEVFPYLWQNVSVFFQIAKNNIFFSLYSCWLFKEESNTFIIWFFCKSVKIILWFGVVF